MQLRHLRTRVRSRPYALKLHVHVHVHVHFYVHVTRLCSLSRSGGMLAIQELEVYGNLVPSPAFPSSPPPGLPSPIEDCSRPDWWCGHPTAEASNLDCDGDGQLDWTCVDGDGARWALLSSKGCSTDQDFGGNAPLDACPQGFSQPPPSLSPEGTFIPHKQVHVYGFLEQKRVLSLCLLYTSDAADE